MSASGCHAPSKIEYKLVVAIDFGTTYTGYAYSFRDEFEANHLNVTINPEWTSGNDKHFSKKTPTSLLLTPEKELHSFGYAAEQKFMELVDEESHSEWYFFRRFKMKLHSKKVLKRGLRIKDDLGKVVSAKTVFAMAIRAMTIHLKKTLEDAGNLVPDEDILWVLTVPAIWKDSAKQFMRESAVEAGIDNGRLVLALEPEAASLYCQLLPIEKLQTKKETKFTITKPGQIFMVADLGGGTADLTVHKRKEDGNLEEVYAATGGAWGGVGVDRQFLIFITKLMGPDVMSVFSSKYPEDMFDMYKCLESLKRTINPSSTGKVSISIPTVLAKLYEDTYESKFGTTIPQEFEGKVTYGHGKLRVEVEVVKSFFVPVVEEIVNHIKTVLSSKECARLKTVIMVGGFSDSSMVTEAVEESFPNCRIIVPMDCEMAVLKGAVIYGHAPETISNRIMRYTYGVSYMVDFDSEQHPEEKKVFKNEGEAKCKDLFETFVEAGQLVRTGEVISKVYSPARSEQTLLVIKVYASTRKSPSFVSDDGCWKLGKLLVELPQTEDNKTLEIEERMIFGDTELKVEAIEPTSGKTFTASFDFL